ncbi:MAG: putative S-layer protein, partial [Candidatus Heimdallarchaeota archaeon]
MKNKILGLFAFSIFALVFLMSAVSALSLSASPSTVSLSNSSDSATVNVSADGLFNLTSPTPDTITITDADNHWAVVNLTATEAVNDTSFIIFDVNLISVDSNFNFGKYIKAFNIAAVNSTNTTDTDSVLISIEFEKEFYEGANDAKLKILRFDFDVLEGFGDDEDFWYPLDEIEVEFRIDNSGDWDVENIEIEACLFDIDAEECVLDERDMEISEDDFDLDENDEQRVRLTFIVDPEELNVGNTKFTFFVSAVGTIDDFDAGVLDGKETGISDSKDIEIRTKESFVIVSDITLNPEIASCGETVELEADVWNIGNKNLDDDEVFLRIYNAALGIDETIEFSSGIDALEYEKIVFMFDVPSDVDEKTYVIDMTAYDDEDMDDNDLFETKENDEAEYSVFLKVEGNCAVDSGVLISASLESEAKAGKEMVISVLLTNTADVTRSFTMQASGYDAWAEISELPGLLTLNADSVGEALFKFDIKKGISGEQTFLVMVYS